MYGPHIQFSCHKSTWVSLNSQVPLEMLSICQPLHLHIKKWVFIGPVSTQETLTPLIWGLNTSTRIKPYSLYGNPIPFWQHEHILFLLLFDLYTLPFIPLSYNIEVFLITLQFSNVSWQQLDFLSEYFISFHSRIKGKGGIEPVTCFTNFVCLFSNIKAIHHWLFSLRINWNKFLCNSSGQNEYINKKMAHGS